MKTLVFIHSFYYMYIWYKCVYLFCWNADIVSQFTISWQQMKVSRYQNNTFSLQTAENSINSVLLKLKHGLYAELIDY